MAAHYLAATLAGLFVESCEKIGVIMFFSKSTIDPQLMADFRRHQAAKSVIYIPWATGCFLFLNAVFFLSDRYVRHMPVLSYPRIIPCILAVVLLYMWWRKVAPVRLHNWSLVWAFSYISMFFVHALITYHTDLYKSAIPALMIGIFSVIIMGLVEWQKLALIYFIPLAGFIGATWVLGLADHRLMEMGNVAALLIICLILNEIRERYSFTEYTLTKRLEEVLEQMKATQAQLIQQEKMASLGELTAGIAHEIQNPLNFVINFGELSVDLFEDVKKTLSPEQLHSIQLQARFLNDNLQKIVHHGKRADSIVKGMLLHSRTEVGEKQAVNLNALASEYLHLAYQGLRAKDKMAHVRLHTHLDAAVQQIQAIPQELGRVLLNLYNNAFYAVSEKRHTQGTDYQPEVTVSTRLEGNRVRLTVRDNGPGIDPEAMKKVFQPFFTTKPTGQGTGLGLSISYDIITKGHNGEMTVTSEKDAFAEFTVLLPAF